MRGPRAGCHASRHTTNASRAPFVLSAALIVLMAMQAALGLAFPARYRDVEWIRATWFGNDGVTLLFAVPMLFVARRLARCGSVRGRLVWLGMLGYGVYNYSFYLLGAALNAFFPLYALAVVVAGAALILGLAHTDVHKVAGHLQASPARLVGGYSWPLPVWVPLVVGTAAACILLLWKGTEVASTSRAARFSSTQIDQAVSHRA
jgi:hypothetical protein